MTKENFSFHTAPAPIPSLFPVSERRGRGSLMQKSAGSALSTHSTVGGGRKWLDVVIWQVFLKQLYKFIRYLAKYFGIKCACS